MCKCDLYSLFNSGVFIMNERIDPKILVRSTKILIERGLSGEIRVLEDAGSRNTGDLQLYPNFPDPFREWTSIQYFLPRACRVQIKIFDPRGEAIRFLVDRPEASGLRTVVWDGKDEYGRSVPGGTYTCLLRAGSYVRTRQLHLLHTGEEIAP